MLGQSILLAGGRYIIQNSCRFRSEAAPKLAYTPVATPAERRKWTFSAWVRRSKLATDLGPILYAGDINEDTWIGFNTSDQLHIQTAWGNVTQVALTSAVKFRDTSGWYHIMVVADTSQTVAADRMKVYVNGVQIVMSGTFPSQNQTTFTHLLESGWVQQVGQYRNLGYYFDGAIAEHRVIPEVALTPSCFGEFVNGAWCPKAYNTTYGAYGLGWFLEFKNSAALGADSGGGGHTFAASAVAAGDQLVDTPTTVYPTLDPLNVYLSPTLTNGGLTCAGNNTGIAANIGLPSTGKWVWEVTIGAAVQGSIGITKDIAGTTGYRTNGQLFASGQKWQGGGWVANGAAWTIGSVIGLVVDCDAQTVNVYKDGVLQGTGLTAIGDVSGWFPYVEPGTSGQHTANFGQRPFTYSNAYGTAKALNTDNMREFSRRLSGTFIGTATSGDGGPEVWIGGKPETLLINGNAVIFGTHANARAGGFAVITSSSSYNASGSNTWTATVATAFVNADHVPGPAVPNS